MGVTFTSIEFFSASAEISMLTSIVPGIWVTDGPPSCGGLVVYVHHYSGWEQGVKREGRIAGPKSQNGTRGVDKLSIPRRPILRRLIYTASTKKVNSTSRECIHFHGT